MDDDGITGVLIPWDRPNSCRRVDLKPNPEFADMGAFELPGTLACPWDFDDNGIVDLPDLALMLANYGLTNLAGCPCYPQDFDCDGDTDLPDLAEFLAHYGLPCANGLTGGGENMMFGGSDPLTQWLLSATPAEVLAWWYAGMPPVGGEDW